jgi:hypothetical protein
VIEGSATSLAGVSIGWARVDEALRPQLDRAICCCCWVLLLAAVLPGVAALGRAQLKPGDVVRLTHARSHARPLQQQVCGTALEGPGGEWQRPNLWRARLRSSALPIAAAAAAAKPPQAPGAQR